MAEQTHTAPSPARLGWGSFPYCSSMATGCDKGDHRAGAEAGWWDDCHFSRVIPIFVIFLGKHYRIRAFIRAHRGGIWSPVHKTPEPQRVYAAGCRIFESFLHQKTHTRSKSFSFSWRRETGRVGCCPQYHTGLIVQPHNLCRDSGTSVYCSCIERAAVMNSCSVEVQVGLSEHLRATPVKLGVWICWTCL